MRPAMLFYRSEGGMVLPTETGIAAKHFECEQNAVMDINMLLTELSSHPICNSSFKSCTTYATILVSGQKHGCELCSSPRCVTHGKRADLHEQSVWRSIESILTFFKALYPINPQ